MATTWQPKHDQLIVKPLTSADRTSSGLLVIPDEHRERPQTGIVLAAGPGLVAGDSGVLVPVSSQVGDLVAFGRFAGSEFDLDGQKVLVMRDLEAIMRKPEGSYELVEHEDGKFSHEKGFLCEHCPRETSTVIAEERERLRLARAAADAGVQEVSLEELAAADQKVLDTVVGDEPFADTVGVLPQQADGHRGEA